MVTRGSLVQQRFPAVSHSGNTLARGLAVHLDQHATGRTDRVFTAPQGGPLRWRGFRKRFWHPAVAASVGQPMRFHDLRQPRLVLTVDQDHVD